MFCGVSSADTRVEPRGQCPGKGFWGVSNTVVLAIVSVLSAYTGSRGEITSPRIAQCLVTKGTCKCVFQSESHTSTTSHLNHLL